MSAKRAGAARKPGKPTAETAPPVADVIQNAKRQLEQMIDLNPESMVLVDAGGKVLRANRAFVGLVGGRGFAHVLGQTLAQLFPVEDGGFFSVLLASRTSASREVQVQVNGAGRRLLRFTVVAGVQGSGTLIVIAHDATLERSEAELIEKAYKVEAVRALMGALMHHLNQPLTVLMVRAKLMQQAVEQGRIDAADLKETFKDIMDLTMRMANVLKRVEESDDYQTQRYIGGLDILKIDDER